MTINTSIGYEIDVDKDKVMDYELSYLIGKIQNDTPELKMKHNALLLDKLLGGSDKVMDFFAYVKSENDGVISQQVVSDFILEIITALGNGKKK